LVTAVHCAGGARLNVCCKAKLPPLFVHETGKICSARERNAICGGGTFVAETQPENSDVLFAGSIAVAVDHPACGNGRWQIGREIRRTRPPSVMFVCPRKTCPSPKRTNRRTGWQKTEGVYVFPVLPSIVPRTRVVVPLTASGQRRKILPRVRRVRRDPAFAVHDCIDAGTGADAVGRAQINSQRAVVENELPLIKLLNAPVRTRTPA